MIDNDWYIINAIFYASRRQPVYPAELSEKEVARLEQMRATMMKTVLPLLGMVRFVASKFPPEAVEAKLTPEWFLDKGRKRFPVLVRVVKGKGEKGQRWLERQVEEIRKYCVGKLVWSEKLEKMVDISELKRRTL